MDIYVKMDTVDDQLDVRDGWIVRYADKNVKIDELVYFDSLFCYKDLALTSHFR